MSNWLKEHKGELLLLGLLTLLALSLRLWRLDSVPPGWRDDELINILVISQKVLDGNWAVYYSDASGHEALYHALAAGMVSLFGLTALGIRGLSVILGTLTVPLTYLVGRKLFNRTVGLVAALGLAFSFWSLMYSRTGIRHISVVFFTLPAFYFLWRGLAARERGETAEQSNRWLVHFGLAGLFLGLNFYTYFASRGVPLIVLALVVYLALFERPLFKQSWPGFLLLAGVTAVLALPLVITLNQQPDSEARVSELAVPLLEARQGNFAPLQENIFQTLSMFHSYGDDEWLYNIPFRPVFGAVGALFFGLGLLIALWKSIASLLGRSDETTGTNRAAYPFLLVWWLAGIAPGFISVPAASLGHTIIAQPAVYLLAALPVGVAFQVYTRQKGKVSEDSAWYQQAIGSRWLFVGLALLLVGSIAWRDTADYFAEWPNRGMTRFLYRANIRELTQYLDDHPELTDFGATSLLAGPWDKRAFEIDLSRETAAHPRWYNPERAILLAIDGQPALNFSGYPVVPVLHEDWYQPLLGQSVGGYQLTEVNRRFPLKLSPENCFQNGLCWLTADYDREAQTLEMVWYVERPLTLPEEQLISNPPPPGVYVGPRLSVFGQLVDGENNFLAGDDGLWVDVYSLYPGDAFLQQHRPMLSEEQQPAAILLGLYDPMTGERILTETGQDHIRIDVE
ncbi:MAG: glycosyltransferase family 39 protein [Candidatus Promineifilaceae bacterium]